MCPTAVFLNLGIDNNSSTGVERQRTEQESHER